MARKESVVKDEKLQEILLDLKYHPAILELKFVTMYDELFKFYGGEITDKLLEKFCEIFECDYSIIQSLINNKHRIQINKVYNLTHYRRMILVMAYSWGEDKAYIARHYFPHSQTVIYRGGYVDLRFLTSVWIDNLTHGVCVLNTDESVAKVKNLLINLDVLFKVFR